jgi:hypothetical protein
MNIAMACHSGDQDQAERLLDWVAELGGVSKHRLFLMPAKGQMLSRAKMAMTEEGNPLFESVILLTDYEGVQSDWSASNAPVRDASGPNSMFRQFAWHFHLNALGPWFFCEPDAIPLRPDWADRIEAEYLASRKLYMGARVPRNGDTPEHSTGNMVLPQDAAVLSQKLMLPRFAEFPDGRRIEVAFDVAGADDVLANFHETRLIQHVFRGPELNSLESIRDDAVIFHTCKRGEIIPLLRDKLSLGNRAAGEPRTGVALPPLNTLASSPKPKVYTYFSPVPSREGQLEQRKLIELWEKTWQANGWFTHVLTEEDARKHPKFNEWEPIFRAFPTVNPKSYEMAAWNRWIAMAEVGGGFLTDYDTINFGFKDPTRSLLWPNDEDVYVKIDLPLILCGQNGKNRVPCVVHGSEKQFLNAIDGFLACTTEEEAGKPHLSDMIGVQQMQFPWTDICREYRSDGWGSAKLIHCSHASCKPELRSKVAQNLWEAFSQKGSGGSLIIRPEVSQAIKAAPTWIGTVRARVQELAGMADSVYHRAQIHQEMRKANLIPMGKKRK